MVVSLKAPKVASRAGKRRSVEPRGPSKRARQPISISQYLIQRLHELGIRHVFGIPGDYVLRFYDALSKSPIEVVGTTREDCAGFAADAYARIHGLGAVCVTYCVGGLSVVNSVAGAYAEKSPVVVISGSPGLNERARNALLHHKVRDFDTQREVFEKITVANTVLDDPLTAFRSIDRVLDAAQRYKRPVYIELPRDQADVVPLYDHRSALATSRSDPKELQESLAETIAMLEASTRPVLLIGVEVHRFGLQDQVVAFAEKHKMPMCSTLLGKSVVSEAHPLYVGLYEGAMGRDVPRRVVEASDCLLMLGTFMTDINLGIYTAQLDPARCVCATSEDLRIRYHHFHDVLLADYINELAKQQIACPRQELPSHDHRRLKPFEPSPDVRITVRRLFEKVNSILNEEMVVICDVGDALFAGADLTMLRRTEFIAPAYYTSMGFAIPATLGALCADPSCRPIALVGDGAFQMTGMELSNIHRRGLAPIIIVLNNRGYSTERFILDGPFNDIGNWNYHKIPEVIGGGWGFEVHTETDLAKAVEAALANRDSFSLLNVHLDPYDRSEALERLTDRIAQQMGNSSNRRGSPPTVPPAAARQRAGNPSSSNRRR